MLRLGLYSTGAMEGTGNDQDNWIFGNSADNILRGMDGNDELDGDYGADTLIGGKGDDVLYVDTSADQVIEDLDEGRDRVIANTSFTLASNVEDLRLVGAFQDSVYLSDWSGTGNELDNRITGSDARNSLYGLAGADSIDGQAGNDWIRGGEGDDTLFGGNDAIHLEISGGGYGGYYGDFYGGGYGGTVTRSQLAPNA